MAPRVCSSHEFGAVRKQGDLVYEKEYNLNRKPLEIDLLVIKKNRDAEIVNEIGKLFRGHNILEYKSPGGHLNIDTFYKAGAYASLYKAYGETVDGRKADDITVSIVRQEKPEGLFAYFKEHGIRTGNPCQGIYYVLDGVQFPTQIIVAGELAGKGHTWLKSLSEKLGKQEMEELLASVSILTEKFDRELAEAVLEISVRANRQVADELRGDGDMCQALLEIMEPEINKIVESEIQKSVVCAVKGFRELNADDERIRELLMENYGFTREEAEAYL